jgi:hypothetical protein
MDLFEQIISLILIGVVATDLAAAFLLLRGAARSDYSIVALNERAFVALTQAVSGVILALLGVNRLLGWHWSTEVALVMLSVALVTQALPGFVWVSLYLFGKFGPRGQIANSEETEKK